MIGLEQNKVILAPYSSSWMHYFLQEKEKIQTVLNKNDFIDIQHVGSTSIPNMIAKPIIDIGIAVENFEKARKTVKPICNIGYTYKGENGIPKRHYFIKDENNKTLFHIHMNEIFSKDWINQIYFRDYLRKNKEKANNYANLKKELWEKFPENRDAYLNGKAEFISSILSTREK
jgi:GrpB-like predicted nucleotidyltransferase (UPF0157 family)